jgi:glycosyltransferase involved in cell wall biosynthesis
VSLTYPVNGDRLRLLYYIDGLGIGGAFQTTLTVARQMKANGHEVLIAGEGGRMADILKEAGIPHVPVGTEGRHPSPTAVRRLVAAIRRFDIHLLCPNGFDCTLDAVAAGLITGCPMFPTYGGMFNLPYPHPRLPLVNVFSQELMVDLIERYGWKRETFRNLIARIDQTRFSPEVSGSRLRAELGIAEDQKVLVMVCRHDRLKRDGVLALLDAAQELYRAEPRMRLVLFGDGDAHAAILQRIDQIHGLTGATFILAPGGSRRTPEAFAMADLVVANGARSALEGMACGKAVLSVGPNGFCGVLSPETIEGFRRFNFDKGRLAGNPLGDRAHLVGAVLRLLHDEALHQRLREFSLTYAREHLVIQTAAASYEKAYREAIQRGFSRWGVLASWCAVVARFYAYRLRVRFGLIPDRPPDEPAPPPRSLDPDWRLGLEGGDAEPREASSTPEVPPTGPEVSRPP